MSILKVHNLSIIRGEEHILEDVNFEVRRGQVLAIVGPNGAGKTMLFRALLQLTEYDGGVEWEKGVKIGYVPQRFSVERALPLTVNEFFGLRKYKQDVAIKMLQALGVGGHHHEHTDSHHIVSHILRKRLADLSGGELQRVLIAYVLLDKPDVLLFDEPTSGVDIGTEETIYGYLHRLQDEEKLTILLISHDLHVVYTYADQVLCLNKQKVCFGEPTKVLDEATLRTLYGGDVGLYRHKHE